MNIKTSSYFNLYFKKTDCECKCKNEYTNIRMIELKRGNIDFRSNSTENSIRTHQLTSFNFIPKLLYKNLSLSANIFYLIISIIQLANHNLSPFDVWINIFPLGVYILFACFKDIYFNIRRWKDDKATNSARVKRLAQSVSFFNVNPPRKIQEVKSEELEVGNLVILNDGDFVPADILLLDTSEVVNKESICYVSEKYLFGGGNNIEKHAPSVFKLDPSSKIKKEFLDYKTMLSATIEYESPTSNLNDFKGVLKKFKDPLTELLSINNLLLRGSKIKNTAWIIGVVIYTGQDTKIMMNSSMPKKSNFGYLMSRNFNIAIILLAALLAVITTIGLFGRAQVIAYVKEFEPQTANALKFFYFLVLYAHLVPISIYFTFNMLEIIHTIQVSHSNGKSFVKVYEPVTLSTLGLVDYAFIDTEGILTNNEQKVRSIYIKDTLFEVDTKEIDFSLRNREFQRSFNERKQHLLSSMRRGSRTAEKTIDIPDLDAKFVRSTQSIQNYDDLVSQNNTEAQPEAVPEEGNKSQPFTERQQKHSLMLLNSSQKKYRLGSEDTLSEKFTEKHDIHVDKIMQDDKEESESRGNRAVITLGNQDQFLHFVESKDHDIDELLSSLLLCTELHLPKNEKKKKKNTDISAGLLRPPATSSYFSNYIEETAFIDLATQCEVFYDRSQKIGDLTEVKLNLHGNSKFFHVEAASNSLNHNNKYLVLVKNPSLSQTSQGILYMKGPFYEIFGSLENGQQELPHLEAVEAKMSAKGQIPYLVAKRYLRPDEYKAFKEKYKNTRTHLSNQKQALNSLFEEYARGFHPIAMLGLEQQYHPGAKDIMKTLYNGGITTWLFTRNDLDHALQIGRAFDYFSPDRAIYIDGNDSDQIKNEIRRHLNYIQNVYENEKRKKIKEPIQDRLHSFNIRFSKHLMSKLRQNTVVVSGRALDIIFQDSYCKDNFSFIVAVSGGLIGFKTSAQNKQSLVNLVKQRFILEPQVLAIGNSYSDVLMMNSADIGICVANERSGHLPPADIVISDIAQIKKLILYHGLKFSQQLDSTIYYLYYAALTLALPQFYFNWYASNTGTSIYGSTMIFLYYFVFTLIPVFSLSADEPFPKAFVKRLPGLYVESKSKKRFLFRKFLLRDVLESVLQTLAIFYLAIYHVARSYDSDGQPASLEMVSLSIIIPIVFTVNAKMYLNFGHCNLWYWSAVLFSWGIFFGYIWVEGRENFSDIMISDAALDKLLSRLNTLFLIFMEIFLSFGFSYIMHHYVIFEEVSNAWQMIRTIYRKRKGNLSSSTNLYSFPNLEEFESLDNAKLLSIVQYKANILSRIVKKIYRNSMHMESFMLEMLSSIDANVGELNMHKWSLRFKDPTMESRFQLHNTSQSFRFSQFVFYLALILFIAYTIANGVIEKEITYIYAKVIIVVVAIGFGIFIYSKQYKQYYNAINILVTILVVVAKLLFDYLREVDGSLSTVLLAMVISSFLSLPVSWSFFINLCFLIGFYIRLGLLYNVSIDVDGESKFYIYFSYYILITAITLVSVFLGREMEKSKRIEFAAELSMSEQNSSYSNILSVLVPDFVKSLLDRGLRYMSEDQGEVAILFCDICNFDQLIQSQREQLIVLLIDKMYRAFDEICANTGVQKIETVGKTYMACAGLKSCETEIAQLRSITPTRRLVNAAIGMMHEVEHLSLPDSTKVKIKIGIHYGRVIAGVIGKHKPQFSLVGDSVNTTSRVCSGAKESEISLSARAYEKLPGCELTFKKSSIYAKGIGRDNSLEVWTLDKGRKEKHEFNRWSTSRALGFHSPVNRSFEKPDISFTSNNLSAVKINNRKSYGAQNSPRMSNVINVITNNPLVTTPMDFGVQNRPSIKEVTQITEMERYSEDSDLELRTEQLRPNRLFLTFSLRQKPLINEFEIKHEKRYKWTFYIEIIFYSLLFLLQTLIILTVRSSFDIPAWNIVIRAFFSAIIFANCIFKRFVKNLILQRILLMISFIYGDITILLMDMQSDQGAIWFKQIILLEITFALMVGTNTKLLKFVDALILSIPFSGIFIFFFARKHALEYDYIFYYFIFTAFNLINVYINEYYEIRRFNVGLKQNQQNFEQSMLVSKLLPLHALEKLKKSTQNFSPEDLTDNLENVTMLYADIKGFTAFSNSREPERVVDMLSRIFSQFDDASQNNNVFKLYTIGDCYVVLGCRDARQRNPAEEAENVLKMGRDMIRILQELRRLEDAPDISMRVGIHTGNIIGGIIATNIVRYDIYGADVLVANKMESEGEAGKIQISENTKKLLDERFPGRYKFTEKKVINIEKLKITVNGHFLIEEEDITQSNSFVSGL